MNPNQSSNSLRRWTDPTNIEFYNKNSQAIKRYSIATWIVQGILGLLAFNPAARLLEDLFQQSPMILAYVPYIVCGLLLLLHYVLHEEALEALTNALDDDDKTNNAWHDWAVPALICVVMIIADISGARYTLFHLAAKDQTHAISGENNALKNEANAKYKADVTDIESQYNPQISAAATPFNNRIATLRRTKCYDDWDRSAINRKVANEAAARDNAIAAITTAKADELKAARTDRDAALKKAGVRKDSFEAKNATTLADAAITADNGSWIITAGCWVLFGFMIFRLVYLRIGAGIKPIRAYSQMDAMGSPFNNFVKLLKDGLTRQMHRLNAKVHSLISYGADKVPGLDFTVVVEDKNYNGARKTANFTPNGGGNLPPVPMTFTKSPTPSVAAAKSTPIGFNRDNETGNVKSTQNIEIKSASPTPSITQSAAPKLSKPLFGLRPSNNKILISYHEAGHAVVYFAYCVDKNIEPMPHKIILGADGGGAFKSFHDTNNRHWKGMRAMAGFAAECYALGAKRTDYFKEIATNQKKQPDWIEAMATMGTIETVELAFQKAFQVISDNNGCLKDLTAALYKLEEMDYCDILGIANKYFVFKISATPSVKTETTGGLGAGIDMPIPTFTTTDEDGDPTPAETLEHYGLTPKTVTTNSRKTDKTVVTPVKTVTTTNNSDNSEFSYGDELLKSMKGNFGAELNNLKTGNGKTETVITRLIAKSKEFDTAVRTVKATPKLRNQICDWVADNVAPVISNFRKSNKEGSDE